MTLGEAKKIAERKFIKPADDKCFEAKVYEPGEFKAPDVVPDDYPVLISEPVEFDLEYRTFTNGEKVLTWSNYVFYEHIADPKYWDVIPHGDGRFPHDWVNDMLHDLKYHDRGISTVPSVIDVGRIKGKGWAIIETNPAWASGLYGCDPVSALKVMGKVCE